MKRATIMIITATTVINHAFRSIRALDRGWLVISLRKNLLAVVGLAITARTTERGGRVPFFFFPFSHVGANSYVCTQD